MEIAEINEKCAKKIASHPKLYIFKEKKNAKNSFIER